jgi:uncharacterized protein YbjT (DUF2867 family)
MGKRIAIIGSNGSTGKELLQLALREGFEVTVVVRNPLMIGTTENLTVLQGDVTNLGSLLTAFEKIDAVISCLGPANGMKAGNLMSQGTMNIVTACEKKAVKQFIMMSGILQSDGKELSFLNRVGIKIAKLFFKNIVSDKLIAEATVQKSGLQWVIVRAVGLSHKVMQNGFTAGVGIKVSPFRALAYADCAACLLKAVENPSWARQIINVGK